MLPTIHQRTKVDSYKYPVVLLVLVHCDSYTWLFLHEEVQ